MYTQCPECETTFKLGAEDLRLANGKVRCGDCNHVFNALEFLAEEVEEELVGEGAEAAAGGSWTSSESNPSGELEPDLDEYESSAYLDEEDEIVRGTLACRDREVRHGVVRELLDLPAADPAGTS